VAALPKYSIFEICAGLGWLGRGLQIGLESIGVASEVVGCIEREAVTAAGLMAGMEGETGRSPPIWDDAESFVDRRGRRLESVDIVAAGYPCPPFSQAGRRGGFRDARNLWPTCRRIIARLKPELVFLENVSGQVSNGAGKVIRDTERLGYGVTAGLFSASEVGATHLRNRLFILGLRQSPRVFAGAIESKPKSQRGSFARRNLSKMANDPGSGRDTTGIHDEQWQEISSLGGRSQELGDADFGRRSNPKRGKSGSELAQRHQTTMANAIEPDIRHAPTDIPDGTKRTLAPRASENLGLFPPGPNDYGSWARLFAGGLDPAFRPAIESGVSVVANGLASAADLLRIGGNGVVPLQAAWGFINLFACAMEPMETP